MNTDFLNQIINIRDIDKKDSPVEYTFLENNEKQLGEISDFLGNDKKLLIINGFKGTGKSLICDFILNQLRSEVITLRYRCFETTILDDMLLAFFDIFRKYAMKGRIVPPKIKVDNFAQKINSYFNHIAAPVVVILNSFDSILKPNKPDILNFIKHLAHSPNIKIIITSKKYTPEDFENIETDNTTLLAYTKEYFEKYLKSRNVKQIGVLSNELYKHTKGYYDSVKMSVNIMEMRSYSIADFLKAFSESFITFQDFITREELSAVDPVSIHLFRLLAMMRIPIHINLLKSLNLYKKDREDFFIENSILQKDGDSLYLDEDLRDLAEHQIPDNVAQKLHKSCIDLYNTQLPLKPLERDLKLSRQTMRNEIDYHSLFLPKKQFIPQKPSPLEVKVPETAVISPEIEPPEESKEDKIKKINFIIDDEAVLDNIAESIKGFVTQKSETQEIQERSSGLGVTKLVNLARQEEGKYNYKHAIMLYQNALTKRDDPDFLKFLPTIYVSLARDYRNLSRWYEALEYYTQAQDFYYNASNKEKTAEMKLEIANIYSIIYKHDNAKYILGELEKDTTLPHELQIKIILSLGELSEKKRAHEYYERAISLADNTISRPVLSELYYKFAASCDEMDETKTAIMYYKKCLDTEPNLLNNRYSSQALSNLAEIYDEAGASSVAERYYKESINIDKAAKNYNGLYASARSLAQMYSKDAKKSLEWLNLAYDYARQLNEPYYITDSALELGNFYLLRKDYENACKYFFKAYSADNKMNSADVLPKIEQIKNIIGEENFLQLKEKYDK